MIVEEMSRERCLQVLAEARLARLACAADNQPYVVPVYLAYHHQSNGEDYMYGFTSVGQKVEWMRANPLVCVEVDNVSNSSEWVSVVAIGRYEELPNVHEQKVRRATSRSLSGRSHKTRPAASEYTNEQLLAHKLLEARSMWWEPGATVRTSAPAGQRPNRISPVFYKIRLIRVTGFRAQQEQESAAPTAPSAVVPRTPTGWLQRKMNHWLRPRLGVTAWDSRNMRIRGDSHVL